MQADTPITSRANPLLQRAAAVLAGREEGTLALEGERLVRDALRGGTALELVLVSDARPELARSLGARAPVRVVADALLARVSGLKTAPGVLALAPVPAGEPLARWPADARTLLLVAAGVADPGNLGALARAAEALGANGLVALGGASPWSAKALRGSMGSLLRLPVARASEPDALARELDALGYRQAHAATRGGSDPARFDWKGPLALWISGERGETPAACARFEALTLPMAGAVESLNVTVAAALLLASAGRVRADQPGPSDG